jgi:hypothetical protein
MTEVVLPLLALGSMYILANDEKKENFENRKHMEVPEGMVPKGTPVKPPQNYPVENNNELKSSPSYYPSPNASVDKYYNQSVYEKEVENLNDPQNLNQFTSLTGNKVQRKDLKHNNMVPFFGAKITGRRIDHQRGENDSILDNMAGAAKQQIRKKAVAPLFKPQPNMGSWNTKCN